MMKNLGFVLLAMMAFTGIASGSVIKDYDSFDTFGRSPVDGLLYSDVFDVYWIQDTLYSKQTGNQDGILTYSEALAWAEELVAFGSDDWHLARFIGDEPVPTFSMLDEFTNVSGDYGFWGVGNDFDYQLGVGEDTYEGDYIKLGEAYYGRFEWIQDSSYSGLYLHPADIPNYSIRTLVWTDASNISAAVPEPSSMFLMATGLIGLGFARRKNGHKAQRPR